MKNEIVKAKHIKSMQEKLLKFYLQVINYACVKIVVLEIFSEKKTRESLVRTFKSICAVAVQCWYIKDSFSRFCKQI